MAHMVLLTDLLDHGFQALSGPINLGTQLHTRRVSVKEHTTERFIPLFEDESTTERFNPPD
jgi:hypothetical protein